MNEADRATFGYTVGLKNNRKWKNLQMEFFSLYFEDDDDITSIFRRKVVLFGQKSIFFQNYLVSQRCFEKWHVFVQF